MILIDRRTGSAELYAPLRARGLPVELVTLDAGDVAWLGRGKDDAPVPVGVEVKRISDLIASIRSGRLSGAQLPKLIHDYSRIVLLVEGRYREGSEGILEVPRAGGWVPTPGAQGAVTFREIAHYLMTLELRTGVTLRHTHDRSGTVSELGALYTWWTGKSWEDHRAHLALHSPMLDSGLLYRPSLKRRIAAELPGIGVAKSGAVADHFATVRAMVNADEGEWKEIAGIGKGLAKKITEALGALP